MYLLYGSNSSGSASVEAALALCGAEYQVVQTPTAEGMHLTEDFKAINPRQQVPALRLPDGSVMSEGSAMMLHLADALPAARLAPAPGTPARAQHDRWLIFMAGQYLRGRAAQGLFRPLYGRSGRRRRRQDQRRHLCEAPSRHPGRGDRRTLHPGPRAVHGGHLSVDAGRLDGSGMARGPLPEDHGIGGQHRTGPVGRPHPHDPFRLSEHPPHRIAAHPGKEQ